MKKVNLFALIAFILFVPVSFLSAQTTTLEKVEAQPGSLNIPYEKYKLPNGLTLIVNEDHSDPVVNVRITYHVGSAREGLGKSGFAHFFEHMMFEGSEHVGKGGHFKTVSEGGGDLNGNTERDVTNYFETVPSNYLETALWLEADRMGFLLDSVTKEKFENQRATVKNEKGQSVENQPYGLAFYEVKDQVLYPYGHPYSWPVIGYTDDLDRVTVDDLKNFFLRWYGPNNAVLVVSGDVDTKNVLALTEKYFGSIPAGPEVKKMRVTPPNLTTDKYANYIDNVYMPMTLMVYPTVRSFHPDEAPLDILAQMMGGGKSSVFYKKFDKAEIGNASVSHGNQFGTELAGEFTIDVLTYPDFELSLAEMENATQESIKKKMREMTQKSFNETEKKIHECFDEFEKTQLNDSVFQRVKSGTEASLLRGATTVAQKAAILAQFNTIAGKPWNLQDEYDRYSKVTLDDISRVFNKYIKDKHAAIVNVFPKDQDSKDSAKSVNPNAGMNFPADPEYANLKYVKAKDNFDRNKKPLAPAGKSPVVPDFYTHKLNNGATIIGTKDPEAKDVVILIEMKGGDYINSNDPKKVGLAALTADVLDEGTKNYTTERISDELDRLGSYIQFSGGGSSNSIYINSLAKNLDATLVLLQEKLFNPGFNEKDFKRVKKETLQEMNHEKKVPSAIAGKLYRNLMYGDNFLGNYPTEKNIRKFTIEDCKDYFANAYSPSAAKIVVVGDITEADAMKKLDFLNKWQGKTITMPVAPAIPTIEKTQIYMADQEGAVQSLIYAGSPFITYDPFGEYFKASVANYPLGGSFNSRLNLNLREEKGFTYGIYSSFSGSKYPGAFTVGASVRRNATDTAITEIMKEIREFKKDGIKDDEVSFTKNSYLNSEALRYEGTYSKAGFLSSILEYDLPKDYAAKQMQIIRDMSKQDFNAMASKYLNPDKMVILVVGNRYLIKDKLDKLGYGKINDVKLN